MEAFTTGVGHQTVAIALDDAGVAMVLACCFENRQPESGFEIASAEGDAVVQHETVWRIERVELHTEEVAASNVVAHRGRGCQQHHSLDVVRVLARDHRRDHRALGMAH